MAAARAKAAPVGSEQWVHSEQQQAAEMIEQEVDEYGYSVRNELEWLNEHMADIFSTSAVNFADVFKTPGKLRAKTPRTARKRDAGPQRQPLSDIFAPNTQNVPSPAKNTAFYDKVTQFQIAEDGQHLGQHTRPLSRSKSPQRVGKPGNTDSGYHGMTEDEMEIDAQDDGSTVPSQENEAPVVSSPVPAEESPRPATGVNESGRVSDESSFVSAKEGMQSRKQSREVVREQSQPETDNATVPDEEIAVDEPETEPEQFYTNDAPAEPIVEDDDEIVVAPLKGIDQPVEVVEQEPSDQDLEAELSRPASEASSPEKPLQRKSSFTFSSLPAREPLSKRSIGVRESQYDPQNRNSVLARSLGKSFGTAQLDDGEDSQRKSEESKLHGKTSTQLLHERISMLGKTKEPRPSKSIPQAALYPQLPPADVEDEEEAGAPQPPPKDSQEAAPVVEEDDDDDWIAPSKPVASKMSEKAPTTMAPPARPAMHQKSISTTKLPSPTREIMAPPSGHQKAMSVSSKMAPTVESTTPAGSPVSKKHPDAPMSASKKLWTAFKSARNLFASSAGSSAAAKLEAHSNSPAVTRKQKRDFSDESKTAAVINMPGALYSQTQFQPSPSRPVSVVSTSPSRKTRSSTESDKRREKETKAQQKAANDLEKAREKERQKSAKAQEEKGKADKLEAEKREKEEAAAAAAAERPASATSEKDREDMPPPPPPKSMLPAGKLRAPGRLMRPVREAAAKAKPAPVNIRVASQSLRLNQAPSFNREESQGPPPPPKTGLRTNSAQGNARSSTIPQNNSRLKALEAAARKKELEEKEKLRKAEQKRELERKRAAKVEEERRAEQERRAEEQRRMQEAKQAAQRQAEKQAAEAKRREQMRLEQQRLDQQRQQEAAQKAKAAHELAEAIQRERAQQNALPRGDVGGTLRQLASKTVPANIQPNPAKPAKRNFQGEEEEQQAQRPGLQRGPASYQQNDAKRRKTDEIEQEVEPRHSVMAPPKRPSTMRKETLTKFPHGYSHAPPPASHHNNAAASMFKSTVTAQHQMQHPPRPGVPSHPSQTVQLSSARIPFAESNNPLAAQQFAQQAHPYDANTGNPKFKTPGRPTPISKPKSAAKSSPLYPNGDSIALPEIMTDSEDDSEDDNDDTGFRAPSWVASPALRDLLTQQQLVDPETVFGPIAELKMDEVFKGKGAAERIKKFRDRGSSAMWAETGDAVTAEEKRRDILARERMVREGGWRYDGAGAAAPQ